MVLETVHKIVLRKGVSDLDANLESKLMDGFFFCFQEQSGEGNSIFKSNRFRNNVERFWCNCNSFRCENEGVYRSGKINTNNR